MGFRCGNRLSRSRLPSSREGLDGMENFPAVQQTGWMLLSALEPSSVCFLSDGKRRFFQQSTRLAVLSRKKWLGRSGRELIVIFSAGPPSHFFCSLVWRRLLALCQKQQQLRRSNRGKMEF
ncbi:uncharacterized protein LOC110840050 [Zootermopsis nevadensis]|uniref:uncharacterized protein LOC110840050 n=1 Tax=Zootermopsis nevadensis TaxID=136037 RepID=UPI000B8ED27D|nr:uncharacterized protein LOC110840050 [Zootermopsis nevadensis]